MRRIKAPRKSAKGKSLLLTFILLLSLPIFVYGLYKNGSFDITNKAFEDIEVSEENPCVISFPNVNPYSLEVDKTVRVQVDALSKTLGIKRISIQDENQNILFNNEYDSNSIRLTEVFNFTPSEVKSYNISGLMVDVNGKSYQCAISSPYDIKGVRAVANNATPIFTSTARDSKPSQAITTDTTYEYTLTAQDPDSDRINFAYSFTPEADWLKATIIEDGSDGKLTIKFKGSTDQAASYLANIFIHDGYSHHLSSQSWVISVSPTTNDIPIVTILQPLEVVTLKEEDSLVIKWDATDFNHISNYEIYLTSNPTNEQSWIAINKEVSYKESSYTLDLTKIKDGNYKVIVRAIDNQTPPAVGLGISEEIIIAKGNTETTIDDNPVLPQGQVINMSPTSADTVKNTRPTIKASLIAPEGYTIEQDSITMSVDGADRTEKVNFNKISETEYTVIYLPDQPLEAGLHKIEITFQDSNDNTVTKDWTFTIEGTTETNTEDFNIFGFEIPKRTAYIVGGGIALVILAIVIPMVVFAVWKDDNTQNIQSPTLPPTTPSSSDIPVANVQENRIQELVDQTPQVVQPTPPPVATEPAQPVETFVAPEPEMSDIEAISAQIEQIKQEDNKPQKPSTPPEPVL